VFGRLFAALAHAHERGIVHRDLKPANVLLGGGGAQLADFGIARLEAEMLTGPMTRLTETAAVLGTLPYMSPEQRRGGAIDRRSDLFSAGVMLYEAATGALPQGAFPPPSEVSPAYGRAFDRIVMHLLQADPDRRPGGAAQVAVALAAALASRRRRPLAAAVSAGALALLLVGGTLGARMMLRDRDAKSAIAPEAPKRAPAPATPPPAAKAAATEKSAAPEIPPVADLPSKSALPAQTEGGKPAPLGKIKRRVVLKAVSDVKKLRAEPLNAPGKKTATRSKAALDQAELKSPFETQPTDRTPNAGADNEPALPKRN
jgi:hypothetical protein